MTDTSDDPTGLPGTSRAVVLGLTGLLVAVLLSTVATAPLLASVVGVGLVLALSMWLVGCDQWTPAGRLLASLLVAPIAAGLVAVAAGTVAAALGESSVTGGPGTLAALVVTGGCVLAVFGAAISTRGAYDRDRSATYLGVVGRTGLALAVVAGVAIANSIVSLSATDGGDGSRTAVGAVLAPVVDPLFAPTPGDTHLAVFCLCLAVVTLAFERAVTALPLTELVPETPDSPDLGATVEAVARRLRWTALVLVGASVVAAAVELRFGQPEIAGALAPTAYDLLVALTGSPGLRTAMWTLFVASAVTRLAVWVVQRTARSSTERVGTAAAPYVGGSVLAVGLFAIAGPAVGRVQTLVQSGAPTPVRLLFDQQLTPLVASYGAGPVLLFASLAVLSVAGTLTSGLWLALVVRYIDEQYAGVHVAAAGLFAASTFAATLGASTPVVLAGLVGSVVVWDAGAFGTRLRREVGTVAATRRTELTHTGGTVAVGGVGVALTVAVLGVARGSISPAPDTGYLTLLVALCAAVALVVSLR
ncbi:hypothetical protein NDI56_11080 [Haloarcula sp. S1CR25-12]|uniref:Uncharacterized protein n=1 Tax=Haloarcula saliterrae TaxID=2950534 RepID=A0ABU2FCF0_9EURY|nr:hypothetical protein [Haloarcula sp. S1CR25-12]MDS0259937.1 hypothetical protein [Haloarcula sp. S1CR25-12]